jgi:hypothetical protein
MADIDEKLDEINERIIANEERRQLGHRMVFDESGNCNVPGIKPLSGEDLKNQLSRQKKWYGRV